VKNKWLIFIVLTVLVASCSVKHTKGVENIPVPHNYQADYFYMLGYEAYLTYEWEDAVKNYRKALEYDPASSYLKTQLSYALYHADDLSGALSLAEDAVKADPNYVPALELIGNIYNKQKRTADAIDIFKKIRVIDPENDEVSVSLGRLYYNNDMNDEAAAAFEDAIKKDPDNYTAFDYLGSLYIDKKDYDRAEVYLKKALEIRPGLDSVYFKLGIINEIREQLNVAADNYENALSLNPHNSQARERLAQVYVKQKSLGKAIEEFLSLSRNQPDNLDLHVRIGILYFESKEYDRALEEFRLVLKARPDNISVRYYLALVLEEMNNFDEAVPELKKIILEEPKNINAFLHLAYIYTRMKNIDDAIQMYEEILDFNKDQPEIYILLSEAYMNRKDYKKAESVLTGALSRFSNNDELHTNLAMVFEKAGRFDDMVVHLRTAIEINPRNADALNYLGYSLADRGINLEEALSLIKRSLDLKPDNGYILDSLGWVYYKQGKYETALDIIIKASEITKNDPVVLEHLGDTYLALHRPDKAREFWEKSLTYQEKEEGFKERVEKKIRELKIEKNIR
jgi:tetratricopeptide (TPR) repeat protein